MIEQVVAQLEAEPQAAGETGGPEDLAMLQDLLARWRCKDDPQVEDFPVQARCRSS